jgi:hypothetical protein
VAVAYLSIGEMPFKGRKLRPTGYFYSSEERERDVVPHVGDRTPALSRTGEARRASGSPVSGF